MSGQCPVKVQYVLSEMEDEDTRYQKRHLLSIREVEVNAMKTDGFSLPGTLKDVEISVDRESISRRCVYNYMIGRVGYVVKEGAAFGH